MERGDVFYTKKIATLSADKKLRLEHSAVRGSDFICVLLGQVKKEESLPTPHQCMSLLGNIGYFPCDLIEETIGKEAFEKLREAWIHKYGE